MANEPVLVDTGPLLAVYSSEDAHHESCIKQMNLLPVGKAYTCWPVLTEAAYMLRNRTPQRDDLFQSVIDGDLVLLRLRERDLEGVRNVFHTYHDQDVDLADACLVHLANREGIRTVFTLDRRHFGVYRNADGDPFRLVPNGN